MYVLKATVGAWRLILSETYSRFAMKHPLPVRIPLSGRGALRFAALLLTAVLLLISIFAVACTDGTSEDDRYAAITSGSFLFDEENAARNVVEVAANTSWQVVWTPEDAAVSVSPASGSGDGRFTLMSMPEGTTIRLGVQAGGGGVSGGMISVTRRGAEPVHLSVTPETLLFDPDDPATHVVTVESNAPWVATSDAALRFSPASGEGDAAILIEEVPADTECVLEVTAGEGPEAVTARVTVRRAAEPQQAIFALDFGGERSSWVWANQDTSWQTHSGTGAAEVRYAVYNVQIASSYGSAGRYSGASGGSYARMYYNPATDYFTVGGIALPAGVTDYTLSFGALFPSDDMTLALSSDGVTWKPLSYTAAATYNTWTLATVGFTLTEPVGSLYIRFTPTGTERQYGLNFDDLRLVAGGGGERIDLHVEPYRFPELPADWREPAGDRAELSGDRAYFTHWTETVNSRKRVRNYSYGYDTRRHNPVWVAYPLHACYREGGYGRTSPDPWAPDPALGEEYQAKIYRSDGPTGSDPYQYWSTSVLGMLGRSGSWTKGHLCMSSERGGADREINRQTFYPTNVAPQPNASAGAFSAVWSCVEAVLSGSRNTQNDISADDGAENRNIVSDTLFVVAGCHYEHERWTEYDSSNFNEPSPDPAQKLCVIPTHQFKAALRTRSGTTGKRVQDCTADELQAVGFWVETFTDRSLGSVRQQLREIAVPVSYIEQQTGLTLFPEVPAEVKSRTPVPEEWGF